jgi:hypothetical protein
MVVQRQNVFYIFMENAYTGIPHGVRWDLEEAMVAVAAINRTNVVIPSHRNLRIVGEERVIT